MGMTLAQILKEKSIQKVGKTPVVVFPLHIWDEIELALEDAEMINSVTFQKKIARSRQSKKFYTLTEVKKRLGL